MISTCGCGLTAGCPQCMPENYRHQRAGKMIIRDWADEEAETLAACTDGEYCCTSDEQCLRHVRIAKALRRAYAKGKEVERQHWYALEHDRRSG